MSKLYAIIVHGIGTPNPGYAKSLINTLKEKFNLRLKKLTDTSDDFSGELEIEEVLWDDIVADNQERLARLLKKGFVKHKPRGIRAFFSHAFSFVTKPFFKLRTEFAAEFVEDVLGYSQKTGAYQMIQSRLLESLNKINPGSVPAPLSIIAHSLGTVICSDFIYDQQKVKGRVHEKFVLNNFFTLGSPIALFSLRYGQQAFADPIHVEDNDGSWINIFDLDDPIAYPLKNLNAAYDKAVTEDKEVNTGIVGAAHTRYFEHSGVQDIMVEKLVIDWLRLNK